MVTFLDCLMGRVKLFWLKDTCDWPLDMPISTAKDLHPAFAAQNISVPEPVLTPFTVIWLPLMEVVIFVGALFDAKETEFEAFITTLAPTATLALAWLRVSELV